MIAFNNDPQEIEPLPASKTPLVVALLVFITAIAATFLPQPWYHKCFQVGIATYVLGYVNGLDYARSKWHKMAKELRKETSEQVAEIAEATKREIEEMINNAR